MAQATQVLHGIRPSYEWDDPNDDGPLIEFEPISPGPWGKDATIFYVESLEDITAEGAFPSDDLSLSFPNVGELPIVGAYEGAYNTRGPVIAFSDEGQNTGRTMNFGTSQNGFGTPGDVQDGGGYLDDLAGALEYASMPVITDAQYQTALLMGQ